jgi:hypothetical protein
VHGWNLPWNYRSAIRFGSLPQELWQLCDVGRNPPRLIAREQGATKREWIPARFRALCR